MPPDGVAGNSWITAATQQRETAYDSYSSCHLAQHLYTTKEDHTTFQTKGQRINGGDMQKSFSRCGAGWNKNRDTNEEGWEKQILFYSYFHFRKRDGARRISEDFGDAKCRNESLCKIFVIKNDWRPKRAKSFQRVVMAGPAWGKMMQLKLLTSILMNGSGFGTTTDSSRCTIHYF